MELGPRTGIEKDLGAMLELRGAVKNTENRTYPDKNKK